MKKVIIIIISVFCFSCSNREFLMAQTIENVNADQFIKLINSQDGILVDVRTDKEVSSGHIKDATNIDYYASDFTNKLKLMKRDNPIYVYCRSGGRSSFAAEIMKGLGFSKVYNLSGGIKAWEKANYKIVTIEKTNSSKERFFSVSEFQEIISKETILLVDFNTQWCVPCRKMKPIIEQMQNQLEGKAKILIIDADVNSELVEKYKIVGVPVFIVFKEGKEIWRHEGIISKEELTNKLN